MVNVQVMRRELVGFNFGEGIAIGLKVGRQSFIKQLFNLQGFLGVISLFMVLDQLVNLIEAGGTNDDIFLFGIVEESLCTD